MDNVGYTGGVALTLTRLCI